MSSFRRGNPFPNWSNIEKQQLAKQSAKMAAARSAARTTLVELRRSRPIPASFRPRLPARAGEMKQVDLPLTTVNMAPVAGTSVTFINGVAPGTAKYQRIGNKVTPQYIDVQLHFNNLNVAANEHFMLKAALIWDRQPTGVLPTFTDIYQDVSATGGTTSSYFAGRNMDTTDRFLTLASDTVMLTAQGAPSGGKHFQTIQWVRPLRGLTQQFKGSDSLLASVATGALYVVLFSSSAGAANCTVVFNTRYKYRDL